MKIGIVGFGSQTKRILKIFKQIKLKQKYIYKPIIRNNDPKYIINNIKLLHDCDAIFICSPNHTHNKYLKIFSNKYIFCEKPLTTQNNDLINIENKDKIFVNYNYRFSYLSKAIEQKDKFNLGNLLSGNLVMAQGLASKQIYKNSWRSNIKNCKYGVYEILGVHLIDLIAFHFNIKKIDKLLCNFSNKGTAYDTSFFQIILSNKSVISCFVSYFSPFISKQLLIFENGFIEMNHNSLEIRGPRDSFDKKGFFKTPPLIFKKRFTTMNDYEYSLSESVKFFLKKVSKKEKFEKKFLKTSIFTNKLIF
jgi:predicted dehydrogenase